MTERDGPGDTAAPAGERIGLIGAGVLADAIEAALCVHAKTRRFPAAADAARAGEADPAALGDAVVLATDGWDAGGHPLVRRTCGALDIPWIPVRAELGVVVIGPAETAGRPGCAACAERRRGLARANPEGFDAVWRRHGEALSSRPSPRLGGLAAHLVAVAVDDEVAGLLRGAAPPPGRPHLRHVDLQSLEVTTHRFLPDPFCPECGGVPEDDAAAASIVLRSRPKADAGRYRVRDLAADWDMLAETYVDPEYGVVSEVSEGSDGSLMLAAATAGLRSAGAERGFGRTSDQRSSRSVAVLEALERFGGAEPGGKRTAVHAAYRDIRAHALDPRTLGLYPPDRYRLPGFPFEPFDETGRYRWVWGHSFADDAPILVPENCVYYRTHRREAERRPFTAESSNGCALGGCLEEAILHGILEVAERDAFLMTWYARRRVPRIPLTSLQDRTVAVLADGIRSGSGYEVLAFDITVEQDIPCVWAMAVDRAGGRDRPKAVCAAGAHPDPERALRNALSELGPILTDLLRRYPQESERAAQMAREPSLVTAMGDHSLLYGAPETFGRLNFLTDSADRERDPAARPAALRNDDLKNDVTELVDRYLDTGMDVIVVDQTAPEHRAADLSCVKVIIPGTVPMTFGHALRRVDGLPRLRKAIRDGADLNPHPHPFP